MTRQPVEEAGKLQDAGVQTKDKPGARLSTPTISMEVRPVPAGAPKLEGSAGTLMLTSWLYGTPTVPTASPVVLSGQIPYGVDAGMQEISGVHCAIDLVRPNAATNAMDKSNFLIMRVGLSMNNQA